MEIFQLQTKNWFLPRELFLQDPTLFTREQPVYCHILSGAMAKEYLHNIAIVNYEGSFEVYRWRFQSNRSIIPIYSIQIMETIRNEAKISVLCEKLFFQIEDIFDKLDVGEQVFIFKDVIEAVELLSSKFSYFKLSREMLGLNKNGQCKVWINQNYGSNQVQYLLSSEEDQYWAIVMMFSQLSSREKPFFSLMKTVKRQNLGFQALKKLVDSFVTKNGIEVCKKINIARLIQLSEQEGERRYSQFSCRPDFTFKKASESTEMTFSPKQLSINCSSGIKSPLSSVNNSIIPKYSLKIPNHRNKKKKTINMLSIHSKPELLHYYEEQQKDRRNSEQQVKPLKLFGEDSKLQESIVVESKIDEKSQFFDINCLKRLGNIGKFCESVTAEQLILQEFKSIYE